MSNDITTATSNAGNGNSNGNNSGGDRLTSDSRDSSLLRRRRYQQRRQEDRRLSSSSSSHHVQGNNDTSSSSSNYGGVGGGGGGGGGYGVDAFNHRSEDDSSSRIGPIVPDDNDNFVDDTDSQILHHQHNSYDRQQYQQRQRQHRNGGKQLRRDHVGGGSQVFLPRIVNRDMPFHQSRNRFAVRTAFQRALCATVWLARHDWFHILLRLRFITALFLLISIWTIMIIFFAGVYIIVGSRNLGNSSTCLLGIYNEDTGEQDQMTFAAAFAFSLETCTTVGYGLPNGTNSFFEQGCTNLQIAVYFQMIWSMIFNAFLLSFLFSQLSKSEQRAIQLVFSDKLCITATPPKGLHPDDSGRRNRRDSTHFLDENGPITLTVRCYDLDAVFPLVECHARMYLLDHRMKLHPLRLQDPNDELGAMILPSLPTDLVHVIDHHSVLSPTRTMPLVDNESLSGMPMRSIDSVIGSREEIICPVCGESYGTYERLKRHVEYSALVDEDAGFPMYPASHFGFVMPDVQQIGLEEVKKHIERTLSEVVVVVEAIDPQLSGTFQSIQSYKYDDLQFGANFKRCMYVQQNEFTVDMKQFHAIEFDDEWKHLWSTEPHHNRPSGNDNSKITSQSMDRISSSSQDISSPALQTRPSHQQQQQQQNVHGRRSDPSSSSRNGSLSAVTEEGKEEDVEMNGDGAETTPYSSSSSPIIPNKGTDEGIIRKSTTGPPVVDSNNKCTIS